MKTKILASLLLVLMCAAAHAEKQVYQQRVLRPDGKPAVGAKVRVFFVTNAQNGTNAQRRWLMKEDDSPQREVTTQTDVNGQFKVEAQNDQEELHLLIVDAPGCALGFGTLDAPLKLLEDKPVFGKVISQNGQPVSGADVIVSVVGTNTYLPTFIQDPRRVRFPELTAKSQADGSFRLRSATIYGFSNSLQLWALGKIGERTVMGTIRRNSEPEKPYVITVSPTISLRGQVVDDTTGLALKDARVEYSDVSGLAKEPRTTDNEGRFVFENLFARPRRLLRVTHPNYSGSFIDAEAQQESLAFKQPEQDVELRLRRMARVGGTVVDAETGNPLPFSVAIWTKWSQQSKSGWTLSTTGVTSTGGGAPGDFGISSPVGATQLTLATPSFEAGVLEPYNTPLDVPLSGLENLIIKARVKPGYFVQLKRANENASWFAFDIYTRTPNGEKKLGYRNSNLFFPAKKWGETMEIRGVGENQKEVFGWTKITASRELTPTVITFQ